MVDEVVGGVNYSKILRVVGKAIGFQRNYVSDHTLFEDVDPDRYYTIFFKGKAHPASKLLPKVGTWNLKVPPDWDPSTRGYSIITNRVFSYPWAHFYLKLPDFTNIPAQQPETALHFGFEPMHGELSGLIDFKLVKSPTYPAEKGTLLAYCHGIRTQIDLTGILPDNAWETYYHYALKLDRDSAWFYIGPFASDTFPFDRFRVIAVVLFTGHEYSYSVNPPPYGIAFGYRSVPLTHAPMLIEPVVTSTEYSFEVSFGWFPYMPTVTDGDPKPPRTMELYRESSWDTFRGSSIDSGSLTSHPIPVYGYTNVEVLVDADKDFTLEIQHLAPSGVWRTFDTYSSSNGRIHLLIDEPLVLVRLVLTPTAYPLTVNDAYVVMIP